MADAKTMTFLVDDRYSNVDAVGRAVCEVVPLSFERRTSDYLGGDYLLCEDSSGCVVQIRSNYSSFLDEWCLPDRVSAKYVITITNCAQPDRFTPLLRVPGVVER